MAISKIYFHGHNTGEFSGVTVASCDYGDTDLKRADGEIAGRDGTITSHANGRHYKARQMTIVLNVKATPTTIEGVMSSLRAWLSGGVGTLTDDYNTGWELRNVDYVSAHTDYIDMFRGCGQLTVKMTADPYWTKAGTVNTRVVKFTDVITAGESATIAVNGSACTVTRSDGSTQSATLPETARKYRLVVYSANVPTVTMDGAALALDTVFTLPASAVIAIVGAGYAYVELWNDTREVRL